MLTLKQHNDFLDRPTPEDSSDHQKVLNVHDEKSCYYAYRHRDATHIKIWSCLTDIEESAFRRFSQLRQVMIPNNVKSIGKMAFAGCISLREVFLPDSIEWIGRDAFAGCTALTTVHLPYGITEIECNTFRNCSSLREIFLPPSVERIGDGAFCGCENLEAVYGGEGLITIESEAFFGCKKLRRLTLNNAVCRVADDAFAKSPFCLPSTYFGPKSPRASFGRDVIVPDGVQTIGACAFSAQKAPKSITLPDSVRNISRCAFDRDFSDLDGYRSAVTEDTLLRMPQEMNMPAGYLRQQTPYDAIMALALCDTVWNKYVTDADYEAMALYCDDDKARYLAMQRFSCTPSTHLLNMMGMSRTKTDHLTHLAEYLCMYFPLLKCYYEDTPNIVRELYKEAVERGAHDAARLLERYCIHTELFLNDDGNTGMYMYSVSPFEAELIHRFDHSFHNAYTDETQMHFVSNGSRVPVSYIHVIFAEHMKPTLLRKLTPYRSYAIADSDRNHLAALIQQIEDDEWLDFLYANEPHNRNALELLCIFAEKDTLNRLYERYSTVTANYHPYSRISILTLLYNAVCLNDSDDAQQIKAQLKRDIEQAEQAWRDDFGARNTPTFTEELWDDADRWRFLNEQDEDYPFEREYDLNSNDHRDTSEGMEAPADDEWIDDDDAFPACEDDDEWDDSDALWDTFDEWEE